MDKFDKILDGVLISLFVIISLSLAGWGISNYYSQENKKHLNVTSYDCGKLGEYVGIESTSIVAYDDGLVCYLNTKAGSYHVGEKHIEGALLLSEIKELMEEKDALENCAKTKENKCKGLLGNERLECYSECLDNGTIK